MNKKKGILLLRGFVHELKDEIEERAIKKSDFAAEINIQPGHLSEIFSGKRNITTKLAMRLQKALAIDAKIWLTLQMHYDLWVEKKADK